MGAFLDKPVTDKNTKSGEICGLKYAFSAMQGWRKDMEDAHICTDVESWKNWSFFGVFDGHAGAGVSNRLSKDLLSLILNTTKLEGEGDMLIDKVKTGIVEGFMVFDKDHLYIGSELEKKDREKGGSTAVTAFVSPTHIIWANCGDSRGFLCRNQQVHFSTDDHKPVNLEEKKRIEKAGGTVMNQRVNGTLAVSRALGDFEYKGVPNLPANEQLVSPEPDVTAIVRDENDEFLLLACDGIFDVMTNEEICKYVHHQLSLTSNLEAICSNLLDLCLNKNSRDNMSVVLVTFPGAPKVSQNAIDKQRELDEQAKKDIEAKLEEYVREATNALDVEEHLVMMKLVEALDGTYDIYSRKDWIIELLQTMKKHKFGEYPDFNDGDMSEEPERKSVTVFTAEGITETTVIPALDTEQDQQGDNPFSSPPQGTSVDGPPSAYN